MHAQCGVAKLGWCLPGGNRTFSVTVNNKRVSLLAKHVSGEEIRLARVFSILRLHMPSCFATRIVIRFTSRKVGRPPNKWLDYVERI